MVDLSVSGGSVCLGGLWVVFEKIIFGVLITVAYSVAP